MVDLCGIINRDENYTNPAHAEIAKLTNKRNIKGSLADALRGATHSSAFPSRTS